MGKAFVSFLGTNDYLDCIYRLDESDNTVYKYVQEYFVNKFCKEWDKEDEIRIFLTEDAERKNWNNNGHGKENTGLKDQLNRLNLNCTIQPVTNLPCGNTEEEIWQLFEKIFESFKENEEVVFDITHSFRSLPMLMLVLLNYSRLLKNIKIKGIYYGAFEVLGPVYEVRNKPAEERIAPIIDLNNLIGLQDWTLATYNFIENGITKDINRITNERIKPILSCTKGQDFEASRIRDLLKDLETISQNISTCRGREITNFDYNKTHQTIKTLIDSQTNHIKPLPHLLEKIDNKIKAFTNNDVINGLKSVEWCLQHNLYQQGITIFQESLISYVLSMLNEDWQDKEKRELASSAFRIKSQNINEKDWNDKARSNKGFIDMLLNLTEIDKLKGIYSSLTEIRNDINHAGMLEGSREYKKIIKAFQDNYNEFKTIVNYEDITNVQKS
jgi:CRISPR-associated Csx2 family protein